MLIMAITIGSRQRRGEYGCPLFHRISETRGRRLQGPVAQQGTIRVASSISKRAFVELLITEPCLRKPVSLAHPQLVNSHASRDSTDVKWDRLSANRGTAQGILLTSANTNNVAAAAAIAIAAMRAQGGRKGWSWKSLMLPNQVPGYCRAGSANVAPSMGPTMTETSQMTVYRLSLRAVSVDVMS